MKNLETKNVIRKTVLAQRNAINIICKQDYDKKIANKLFATKEYQNAKQLLIYLSFGSEVDTFGIIQQARKEGKEIFCPKVLGDGIMDFFHYTSKEETLPGFGNILEPVSEKKFLYEENDKSALMIMPLSTFDEKRNRLGYGKGFYDRYLQEKRLLNTIALAYEEQKWIHHLPVSVFDIPPNMIITPNRIYR